MAQFPYCNYVSVRPPPSTRCDDFGFRAMDAKTHIHGFDHTRLAYRHAGRDFRLTDVSGEVVTAIVRR